MPAVQALGDQAKGMLMVQYRIGQHEAFGMLVHWSSRSDLTLRVVAETVLDVGVVTSCVSDGPGLAGALARAAQESRPHSPKPLTSV